MELAHRWVRGRRRADRIRLIGALDLPPVLAVVNAHRRLRGPYTVAGTLMRQLVPDALARCPELVARHDVELRSVAPELSEVVPATRETLTSLAVPAERTRFYSRLRTLRMAHGLTEFVRDLQRARGGGPVTIVFDDAAQADPTDAEFLAVLLRRVDPAEITVVVGVGGEPADGVSPERLCDALERHCTIHHAPADDPCPLPADPAAAYVDGDGVSDDPRLIDAYLALDPPLRARLHDRRAAELDARGEPSVRLGALPWHREHGTDPAGAGAAALRSALNACLDMGFYDATVDLGTRGRAVIDRDRQFEDWWVFTNKVTTSLAALSRPDEAEELYDDARAFTTSAWAHRQIAYAMAMLYTRHHEEAHKDHQLAKAWINVAIAFSEQVPDAHERAFATVFNHNGLALIEVHLRNLPRALELVDQGLAHLDRELGADEHRLHRSVLLYNRAQVHAGLGRLDAALADYTAVIELDPNYAEYHFDRGSILRRLGRPAEALADYRRAIALSPPFPEVYYNRADTLLELGDLDGALVDLDYVLELQPDNVDALVNRAGVLLDLGLVDRAAADVEAGFGLDPDGAHLWSLRGRVLEERGAPADAMAAYTTAIGSDATLATAWGLRGALHFAAGDLDAAVADLDRAAALTDDPSIAMNRATALQAAGRHADAAAAYDTVLAAVDDPDAKEQRRRCLAMAAATA